MSLRPSTENEIRPDEYEIVEEERRKREQHMEELLKNSRINFLHMKRRERISAGETAMNDLFSSLDTEKKLEAACALTNIAAQSSLNTNAITDKDFIPVLFQLLKCATEDVRKQAVLTLGNVAADSPECRDRILDLGGMTHILYLIDDLTNPSMLRNATWTLSKFCSGNPPPSILEAKPALPYLEHLLQSTDEEVLRDACCALSYVSDGLSKDNINVLVKAGVIPQLIKLLDHSTPSVLIPALRTIGNIVSSDNLVIEVVLNKQALLGLANLLKKPHEKSVTKVACWTISNITTGNSNQIQAVMESGIIHSLISLLRTAEFDIKQEAAWGILNATSGGTNDQIKFIVDQGCVKPLCDLLISPDPLVIWVCLEALENILNVGETENLNNTRGDNPYALMIKEAEGLEKIEFLRIHDNCGINEKAMKMFETFWNKRKGYDYEEMGMICPGGCTLGVTEQVKKELEKLRIHDNCGINEKAMKMFETFWNKRKGYDYEEMGMICPGGCTLGVTEQVNKEDKVTREGN